MLKFYVFGHICLIVIKLTRNFGVLATKWSLIKCQSKNSSLTPCCHVAGSKNWRERVFDLYVLFLVSS